MTEIKFVPFDRNMLDSMFADDMSECETRHTDTDDSLEEREDEEEEELKEPGMYDDAEEEVKIDGREKMDTDITQ
jgi:hypothetical protein